MKILGIDPGYGITGFGLIDAQRGQYRLLGCGAITTPPNTDFPSPRVSMSPRAGVSFCWPSVRRGCPFLNTSPCRSSRPWWATATPASIRCRT